MKPESKAELCPVVHPRGYRCGLPAGHEGNHSVRQEHHCHARNCGVSVRPEMLMCRKHWFMVPKTIRDEVWRTYRPGQCDDKRPSAEWHKAADAAIAAVAAKEAKP